MFLNKNLEKREPFKKMIDKIGWSDRDFGSLNWSLTTIFYCSSFLWRLALKKTLFSLEYCTDILTNTFWFRNIFFYLKCLHLFATVNFQIHNDDIQYSTGFHYETEKITNIEPHLKIFVSWLKSVFCNNQIGILLLSLKLDWQFL